MAAAAAAQPGSTSSNPRPLKEGHKRTSHTAWLALIPIGILLVIFFAKSVEPPSEPTAKHPQAPTVISSTVASSIAGTEPPIGRDLVLSAQQIKYCVAQGIRLEGIRELAVLDTPEKRMRFNSLTADYDIRCAAYTYPDDMLNMAVADIEPYRRALKLEGLRDISGYDIEIREERAPPEVLRTKARVPSSATASPDSREPIEEIKLSERQILHIRLDELDDACETENAQYGEEAYQSCLAGNRSVLLQQL